MRAVGREMLQADPVRLPRRPVVRHRPADVEIRGQVPDEIPPRRFKTLVWIDQHRWRPPAAREAAISPGSGSMGFSM